jgi:hypothetical protein
VIFREEPFHHNAPYARQLEIFPGLAPEMVARAMVYGSEEWLAKGKHKSAYATVLPGIFARACEARGFGCRRRLRSRRCDSRIHCLVRDRLTRDWI